MIIHQMKKTSETLDFRERTQIWAQIIVFAVHCISIVIHTRGASELARAIPIIAWMAHQYGNQPKSSLF